MKAKVLFVTNKIPHYRLALYEGVGKEYDLVIAHTGDRVNTTFFRQTLLTQSSYGPFIHYQDLEDVEEFDIVVVYSNIRLLNLYQLLWKKKKLNVKIVLFGIGVSASYEKRYDRDKSLDWLRKMIIQRADAAIFYDSYPTIKYSSLGVPSEKLFVAHNTVVGNEAPIIPLRDRDSILFIGSLYKQKGIHQLLNAYFLLRKRDVDLPNLNIIGDGPEKDSIIEWITHHKLSSKIHMLGRITETEEVRPYFSKALCCISPGQAGLSVQNAFSYGVPFVTSHYPVSGGEFTSIIEGVTGFYYNGTIIGLAQTIEKVITHPDLEEIFENCQEFYQRFRSPKVWVKGFSDALDFTLTPSSPS